MAENAHNGRIDETEIENAIANAGPRLAAEGLTDALARDMIRLAYGAGYMDALTDPDPDVAASAVELQKAMLRIPIQ